MLLYKERKCTNFKCYHGKSTMTTCDRTISHQSWLIKMRNFLFKNSSLFRLCYVSSQDELEKAIRKSKFFYRLFCKILCRLYYRLSMNMSSQ